MYASVELTSLIRFAAHQLRRRHHSSTSWTVSAIMKFLLYVPNTVSGYYSLLYNFFLLQDFPHFQVIKSFRRILTGSNSICQICNLFLFRSYVLHLKMFSGIIFLPAAAAYIITVSLFSR